MERIALGDPASMQAEIQTAVRKRIARLQSAAGIIAYRPAELLTSIS